MEKPRINVIPLPGRHYICREVEQEHEPEYYEYFNAQLVHGRLHVMNGEGLHGLIDMEGQMLVPCIWPEIDHHDEYCIIVSASRDGAPPYLPQPPSVYSSRRVQLETNGFLMDLLRHDEPRWYGGLAPDGRVLVPMEEPDVYSVFEKLEPILGPRPEVKFAPWPYEGTGYEAGGKTVGKSVSHTEALYGYEDASGKLVLPMEYYKIRPIMRHTILAQHHSRYTRGVAGGGYHDYQLFDQNGRLISPQWFTDICVLDDGFAVLRDASCGGELLLFFENNGSFTPTDYLAVCACETAAPYYLAYGKNGTGLIDGHGRPVLPAEYEMIRETIGRPQGITARRDNRWYFIEIA